MAAANPAQALQNEASCPICLDYFNDPVSLGCDHNFCRSCISQCWVQTKMVSCPHCRETFSRRNLKPNRQLRTIVEAVRGLTLHTEREAETEGRCEKHREPLKLFCKDDEVPICVVCDKSKQHRDHPVIPAEEAAENFKEKIQAHLKTLREEREKLLAIKKCREKRDQENLKKTQTKRKKILCEFQRLRQFLEEQEQHFLAQLKKLEQEMVQTQHENINKFSVEIFRLDQLIVEMERKCQKPASEFLQDVRSTLNRCEKGKFQQPEESSPELEKGLRDFSQKTLALMEAVMTFKDTLPSALERKGTEVTVTLDPDTAHPWLVLSEDGKRVRYGNTRQDLPDNPERFDTEPCVLGREGFISGRYFWEVEVADGEDWAVGVARDSVRRKGFISHSTEEGIWAVRRWWDEFRALTSPVTPLRQIRDPSRIRVCLDCDWGQVTFFDAGREAPIFTFPPGSVPREGLRPWLWVGDTETRLCL